MWPRQSYRDKAGSATPYTSVPLLKALPSTRRQSYNNHCLLGYSMSPPPKNAVKISWSDAVASRLYQKWLGRAWKRNNVAHNFIGRHQHLFRWGLLFMIASNRSCLSHFNIGHSTAFILNLLWAVNEVNYQLFRDFAPCFRSKPHREFGCV